MKVASDAFSAGKPVRGRPRSFDADEALNAAMRVFWKHGYEGTSLDALTDAMGINRPSLYAAFGNKESLFRKVIDRYVAANAGSFQEALAQPTAYEVIELLMRRTAACEAGPAGCLLVQGALSCSAESEPMRCELSARRLASEAALRMRLERSVKERDLPADADAAGLARFVMTVLHGLSVQATGGATRAQASAVIDVALRAIPKPKLKSRRAPKHG